MWLAFHLKRGMETRLDHFVIARFEIPIGNTSRLLNRGMS
jgi:hypothetical protein